MKRRGYTLFEMVIVVGLIVLLAGLAVPSIEAVYVDYKLQSAVDQVRSKWAEIRARALTEGRPYRFACIPATGDFRVEPYGGSGVAAVADSDSEGLVVQDSLPPGITFAAVNSADPITGEMSSSPGASGGWMTAAVFLPDGTGQQDQEIIFRYADAQPIALRLRALTGGMTSRHLSADGQP